MHFSGITVRDDNLDRVVLSYVVDLPLATLWVRLISLMVMIFEKHSIY
jgi:hypothetical protein